MRRALGWLVPGQGAGGSLACISPFASPAWLQHAAEAAASAAADARAFATHAAPGHTSTSSPASDLDGVVLRPSSRAEGLNGLGSSHVGSSHLGSWLGPSPPCSAAVDEPASPAAAASDPTATAFLTDTSAAAPGLPSPPNEYLLALLPYDAMCTTAEQPMLMSLVQQVANAYELVHSSSGLPWAASIPLTTLALRLALLPLSLRQARIIRTNFSLYKEALALTDQQEQERQEQQQGQGEGQLGPGHPGQGGASTGVALREASPLNPQQHQQDHHPDHHPDHRSLHSGQHQPPQRSQLPHSHASASQQQQRQQQEQERQQQQVVSEAGLQAALQARLLRSQAVLANFHMLRRKCDAPHPAWIVVNPLVQIPIFVMVSTTLGMMCRASWPGLSREGALWFPDLTLPAVVMESGEMPMGPAGLALPLIVYGMTMTSLRLGFGASGLAVQRAAVDGQQPAAGSLQDTALGAFLRSLTPLLYALTTLNLYFKVQMAHGVLVHWVGSAGFTLSLQLALRNPAVRALLKLNKTSSSSSSASGPLGELAAAPPSSDRSAELPSDLVQRVGETSDPNILVIMGAQLSARHHYAGALHCLRKAVLLKPSHVRAHYSMGQVYSLTSCWCDAELSYRAAAQLAAEGPERGQALYCVATSLHAQGKLMEAADAYADADVHWRGQTVIAYGRVNALAAAGQREEALQALAEAEARDEASPGRPFRPALSRLREQLTASGVGGTGGGAGAGDEAVGQREQAKGERSAG